MTKPWFPTSFEDACKRAGGRRRYHAERQRAQWERRLKVLTEMERVGWESYGEGGRLASKLKVSQATLSRDLRYLKSMRRNLGFEAIELIAKNLGTFSPG